MIIKAMKQALEALDCIYSPLHVREINKVGAAMNALRQAIEQAEKQEPMAWMTINAYGEEDDIHYENPEGHLPEGWTYKPLYTSLQPAAQMRMPKAGDKVICLEDESLATVVSLTAGGSPDIVFSDGSRGTYLLREFAELFGYATPQPHREWVGLTDEEIEAADYITMAREDYEVYSINQDSVMDFARAIEAKLKERNHVN